MSIESTQAKTAIVSNQALGRFAQYLSFIAAIVLFPMCLVATTKFASSPFEVFIGVVMGGILAIAMIVMGLVIPFATSPSPRS
jgi:Ca2+/Na+ antiporter